jgi:TM2 domain-containing membrane protein YozV
MAGGFGRKNALVGNSIPTNVIPQDTHLSSQARAFLASERAAKAARSQPEDRVDTHDAFASAVAAQAKMPQPPHRSHGALGERTKLLAYVFWFFAGPAIGAHRLYLGAYQSALVMIAMFWGGLLLGVAVPAIGAISIVLSVLWSLFDVFLIPGLHRKYQDRRRFA